MNLKGKRRTLFLLLALVIVAGGFWLWQVLNAPVPQYQTLIVRPGELQQNVLATGKLDALRKVDVGAQVSGQLKTLSVEIGDKVKKGQLLGVIDPEQAENQIREVEATLMELRAQRAQAQAERNLAQVTLTRQQALAKTQAISKQDLDTAATELAVKQAQIGTIDAQIKRNQASLDTAKTNLDYTKIVAPMAGEVTQITTLQGQTVIAAQQAPNILTLADMSTMLVKAQVSEADVIHLKPGQNAWFTVLGDPQTRYEGVLKDILPTPEKVNDAIFYYARFEVPNPKGVLRLDMTAQVHIQLTGVKNVLTVPLSALGTRHADLHRLRERRCRGDIVPGPAPVHALESTQLQDTVQTPGNKAAAYPHVAVRHQLHETDQYPCEKDLGHPPAFELKKDAREPDFQR